MKKADVKKDDWEWFGYAGHFICSSDCLFHMSTRVGGKYLVSTAGDLRPYQKGGRAKTEPLGGNDDDLFETMVFKSTGIKSCGCCPAVDDYSELDGVRSATANEARETHMGLCRKYAKRAGRGKK